MSCLLGSGISSFDVPIWPDVSNIDHGITNLMQMSFPLTHKVLVLGIRRRWEKGAGHEQGAYQLNCYIHD